MPPGIGARGYVAPGGWPSERGVVEVGLPLGWVGSACREREGAVAVAVAGGDVPGGSPLTLLFLAPLQSTSRVAASPRCQPGLLLPPLEICPRGWI